MEIAALAIAILSAAIASLAAIYAKRSADAARRSAAADEEGVAVARSALAIEDERAALDRRKRAEHDAPVIAPTGPKWYLGQDGVLVGSVANLGHAHAGRLTSFDVKVAERACEALFNLPMVLRPGNHESLRFAWPSGAVPRGEVQSGLKVTIGYEAVESPYRASAVFVLDRGNKSIANDPEWYAEPVSVSVTAYRD
jgi:hypothetical protein